MKHYATATPMIDKKSKWKIYIGSTKNNYLIPVEDAWCSFIETRWETVKVKNPMLFLDNHWETVQ